MKTRTKGMKAIVGIFVFALVGLGLSDVGAQQDVPEDAAQTVRQSMEVVRDFTKGAEDIPSEILENSAGVAVIPDVTRVAFFAGGRHGTGVLLSHDGNQWSLPVFASITGGSVGAQIGVSTTDLLLVFRDRETISDLQREGTLDIGLDLTVAAGPLGGTADWSTIDADVLAYKRTGGLFAGLALTGGSLSTDPEMTYAYYIEPVQPSARGYYADGGGEMLVDELLSLDERVALPDVPRSAMRMKRTMDRLAR